MTVAGLSSGPVPGLIRVRPGRCCWLYLNEITMKSIKTCEDLVTEEGRALIRDELKGKSGVYKIVKKDDPTKFDIGSSVDIWRRVCEHFRRAFKPCDGISLLYLAVQQYSWAAFRLEVLEYCEPDLCYEREQEWLDLTKPYYNNLKEVGQGPGRNGKNLTEAEKIHLSKVNSGSGNPNYGKKTPKSVKNCRGSL